MKKSCFWLAAFLAGAGWGHAQVTMELRLDQEQFLPGESIPVTVGITNRSGRTLRLGADEDWLTFSIEAREGQGAVKLSEVPVVGEFVLESSKRAIKLVDVAPHFRITQPGRYSITATLYIKEWNQQIKSAPKSFDVIEGVQLWEQEIGVPNPSGNPSDPPEVRKYTLQQATYLRKHLTLYLRLTDRTGRLNKVIPVGPIVSIGQPQRQVDKLSNLHLLYPVGPRSYMYAVVNPEGDILVRQTYDMPPRPSLQLNSDGEIGVAGGRRRVTSGDLPRASTTNAPPSTL